MAFTATQTAIVAQAIRLAASSGSDAALVAFATGTLAERAALLKPFVQALLTQAQTSQASQATRNAAEAATLTSSVNDATAVLAAFP